MHILIFEVALSGHHANYLEHIAALFLSKGHRVTVSVLEKHVSEPMFSKLHNAYPQQLKVSALPELSLSLKIAKRLGVAGTELRHWLMFKIFFQQLNATEKVDTVFFPYLDYCLHVISLLGSPSMSVSWAGICMRPSFHYRDFGVLAPEPKWRSIKARLFRRLLRQRGLKKIFTIDELLEKHVHQKHPSLATRLMFVPDPAELSSRYDQASARNLLRLVHDDFIVLVYGAIDQRKGVDQLLQGLTHQKMLRNVRVLVVGRHTPALREQFSREPLVTSIDTYADCNTEEAAFRAADVVWMGYRSHYVMSGVLVLAAMAGKPVLATRSGLIGWMTQRYALGLTIDCDNGFEVAKALHSLLTAQTTVLSNSGMQTIRQRHAWAEFNSRILKSLRY